MRDRVKDVLRSAAVLQVAANGLVTGYRQARLDVVTAVGALRRSARLRWLRELDGTVDDRIGAGVGAG